MKPLYCITILVCLYNASWGQKLNKKTFKVYQEEAYTFRKRGQFEKAINIHEKIRRAFPNNEQNLYNYACVYGLMKEKDSCLKYLRRSISPKLHLQPLVDPDLYLLHSDSIWKNIEDTVIQINPLHTRRIKDLDYAKKLYRLSAADQALYADIEIAEHKFGRGSKQVKNLWKKKGPINFKNRTQLKTLLETKGWPKRSQVGRQAAQSAFLIVQHADLKMMKKHLPEIKKLCNIGEGSCQAYAMMFDRIRTYQGKPQRYGTQVRYNEKQKKYELFPLKNEGILHEFREWAGLPPIENYVKHWHIELNIKKVERDFAYADSLVSAKLRDGSKSKGFIVGVHDSKLTRAELNKLGAKLAIGAKEEACVRMPVGSEITVMFTDNLVVDYPDQADIYIKECGGSRVKALILVSNDGVKFDSLGIAYTGRTSSLDLAKIKYKRPVKFVKITPLHNTGARPSFDLLYIKGMPGSNLSSKISDQEIKKYLAEAKKETKEMLGIEIEAEEKTTKETINTLPDYFILQNVHFDTRSARIQKRSIPYLKDLASELKKRDWKKIKLIGHTDNSGSASLNQTLSLDRAETIKSFLKNHDIDKGEIICTGRGDTEPLMSNDTKDGRSENRRVELRIVE